MCLPFVCGSIAHSVSLGFAMWNDDYALGVGWKRVVVGDRVEWSPRRLRHSRSASIPSEMGAYIASQRNRLELNVDYAEELRSGEAPAVYPTDPVGNGFAARGVRR